MRTYRPQHCRANIRGLLHRRLSLSICMVQPDPFESLFSSRVFSNEMVKQEFARSVEVPCERPSLLTRMVLLAVWWVTS